MLLDKVEAGTLRIEDNARKYGTAWMMEGYGRRVVSKVLTENARNYHYWCGQLAAQHFLLSHWEQVMRSPFKVVTAMMDNGEDLYHRQLDGKWAYYYWMGYTRRMEQVQTLAREEEGV